MTGELRLVEVDPCTDARWDALMRDDLGSVFGSPPWLRALVSAYALHIEARVLVDRADVVCAGLAFSVLDDLRGRRRISVPFVDRLDPIVQDHDQWARLAAPLFDGDDDVDVSLRVLDASVPLGDARLYEHHQLAWHSTDLTRPLDVIRNGLASGVRSNLRHAERHGVDVHVGSSVEDVRAFHRLHRHTRRHKYGLLAQPLSFFEAIWAEFSPIGAIDVVMARLDGEVIAGAMYLQWNDVYYYKFGASIAGSLAVRPNETVHWAGVVRGVERGCRLFDWGVSDLEQPGLVRYKQKFATDERRVSVLRRVGVSPDPRAAEAGRLLGALTALFTAADVPPEITEHAGDLLYRYFA